jgi:lysophospholipid hydrolase
VCRPGTIHAIRDTEIAVIPKILFEALSIQHPAIAIQLSRIIAAKTYLKGNNRAIAQKPALGATLEVAPPPQTVDSAANNSNLKTVCILPVHSNVPVAEFAERLTVSLGLLNASVMILNNSIIMSKMGKHAFTRLGRLKLASWLGEMEECHRLVLYVADGICFLCYNM